MIPFIVSILSSPSIQRFGVYTLCVVSVFMAGFFFHGSCAAKKQVKQDIKEVIRYVERKQVIDKKYINHRFTDECILSGCIPDANTNQQCTPCKSKSP